MKIHASDTVLIITGKYKGKTGKVEKTIPKKSALIVSGVNIIKKHSKPTRKNPKGGIIEKNAPIDSSNALFLCSKCNKATRIGYKIVQAKKIRYCKKCQEQI